VVKKLAAIIALTSFKALPALAQGCAVCSKTAASLDYKGARGLNGGIIYLAFLPLGFMLGIGYVWWKANRKSA
jgi:hypothetical protein